MASMEYKARALYEFVAESSSELSFQANEMLTIISASADSAWWTAQNSSGETGAIPSNYIEILLSDQDLKIDPPLTPNISYDYVTTDDNGLDFQPIEPPNSPPTSTESVQDPSNTVDTTQNRNIYSNVQTQEDLSHGNDHDLATDSSFDSLSSSTRKDSTSGFIPIAPPYPNDNYTVVSDTITSQNQILTSFSTPSPQANTSFYQSDAWYFDTNNTAPPVLSPNISTESSSAYPYPYSQTTTQSTENVYDLFTPTSVPQQPTNNTLSMPVNDSSSASMSTLKPLTETKSEEALSASTSKASGRKFFTLGRKKSKADLERRATIKDNLETPGQPTITETKSMNSSTSSITQQDSPFTSNKLLTPETEVKPGAAKARFFDKYGIDNYLLHGCKAKSDEQVQIGYDETQGGVQWLCNPVMPPFSCSVEEPLEKTKLHGLKSFIEYKIHTQISGHRVVTRRYKQFDWLHEQLVNKFRFICIPPLPEKQIAGRFEQDFIQGRRRQLEIWLNRICRHPVLCASFVVQHFVTCEINESNKDWKAGKRRAEKEELREVTWLHCVNFTNSNLSDTEIQTHIDSFAQQQPHLDIQMKIVNQTLTKYLERHTEIYERDMQRIGEIFSKLQKVLQMDTTTPGNQELSDSTQKISTGYNSVAELYKVKATEGIRDFNDHIQDYIGILSCFPAILLMQRSAAEFIRGLQQRPPPDYTTILHRSQVLNHVVLAEINFFQKERVRDLNLYMKTFMYEQSQFYQEIAAELGQAASSFR